MTWFILDIGFYGFSLDNRTTLADMWATTSRVPLDSNLRCWTSQLPGGAGNSTVPGWMGQLPAWQTDNTEPCNTIYEVLLEQAKQYLLTVSIASIAGSSCFIFFANKIPRRQFLTFSFIALALLFMVTGGVFYGVNHTSASPATILFVGICHFMFNFGKSCDTAPDHPSPADASPSVTGANTLTFIIPAEIFPTSYRCTCHGISAAAGKVGSIIALLLVYLINNSYSVANRQGLVFLLFGFVMGFGAIFSWAYIPDVQRRVPVDADGRKTRLETKNLEDLGEGREKARMENEVITAREKWSEFRRRRRGRIDSHHTSGS